MIVKNRRPSAWRRPNAALQTSLATIALNPLQPTTLALGHCNAFNFHINRPTPMAKDVLQHTANT
eukprot:11138682-Lingulodinium_polyedra.AAC.1